MKQQEVNRVEQPKPQPRPEPKVETKFEPKQPEPPKPIAVQPAQPPQQTKPFESQNPVQQINKPFEPVQQQQQQQYQATTTQNHFQSNQSFDATDFSHSTRQQQQQQEVFQQQTSIKSHQQQQKFESHSTNFASHSSSERKEHHELKHHELNMQVKSGGILRDQQQLNDQEVEDYIGSLRPTTTGAVIRSPQPGDGIFTSAPSMESQQNNELFSQSQLKKTQREGVFGGIAGDHNSLATDAEEYERHTVRNLVQHFSKTKTGDIPLQYLPQQSMQNTGNAPPLSYLKEQAKSKDFSYKEKTETNATSSSEHSNNVTNGKVAKKGSKDYIEDPEVRLGLFQRRGSLKDYLMMDEEKQKQESLPSIQDPSAILQGCKPFVSPDRPPSRTSLRAATNSPPITNNPLYYKNSKLVSPRPFGKQHQSFTSSSTTTSPNKPNLPRPISRQQQQQTSTTPETFIQPSPPTHHSQAQDITQQCIETNTKTNSTRQLTYDQVNVLNQGLQHIEQHQQQMQQQHILKEERQEQRKHIEIKKLQQQEEQRQLAEMQRLMREEEARQQQEEAERKIAADRYQEEQRLRKKQQEEEQRQLAEMQRLMREEEARQQQEEEAERKIAADKLRKKEARKKQEEHRIALQKLKEEEDRKKQMKAQEEEKKKQMKAQEEEKKKLALEKQKQEQLRIEQEKQRILEQQRRIQEEQKRIEAERIRMEVEQKRLEEEQRQIEEFRLRMERAKSSPEEMYYTTEVKVVASPYPSPLTIPNQSPKPVASSTTKDTSPEYYYSSQVVSVTSTPYQSPLTVPSLRQMNESPFQKRSSYHEESYQASDYSQQQQTFFQQQQQRPVSMYEASNLQSHSMQSHTFQSHMQTTNNTTNNNKTTIPMKYSLQPLGGRADLTVRPDMQDDSSSSPDSVSSFRPL